MSENPAKKSTPDVHTDRYEIRIQGILDPCWSEWLESPNMSYTTTGETILSCEIQDQAALHGLLAKIRDMNMKLIAVNRIEFRTGQHEAESKEDEKDDH